MKVSETMQNIFICESKFIHVCFFVRMCTYRISKVLTLQRYNTTILHRKSDYVFKNWYLYEFNSVNR